MSKLMLILGIVVTAVAIAVGLLAFFSPGRMQILGVTPEAAAILLVGGLGLVGIGAVIAALDQGIQAIAELRQALAARDLRPVETGFAATESVAAVSAAREVAAGEPVERSAAEPAAADAAASTSATSETVAALERAKRDLAEALDESTAEAGKAEAEVEEVAEEPDEGQLYVVEERLIRGRPARVLSDGTVEAETDEGWMRFENREHLEEYLDAMSPERS